MFLISEQPENQWALRCDPKCNSGGYRRKLLCLVPFICFQSKEQEANLNLWGRTNLWAPRLVWTLGRRGGPKCWHALPVPPFWWGGGPPPPPSRQYPPTPRTPTNVDPRCPLFDIFFYSAQQGWDDPVELTQLISKQLLWGGMNSELKCHNMTQINKFLLTNEKNCAMAHFFIIFGLCSPSFTPSWQKELSPILLHHCTRLLLMHTVSFLKLVTSRPRAPTCWCFCVKNDYAANCPELCQKPKLSGKTLPNTFWGGSLFLGTSATPEGLGLPWALGCQSLKMGHASGGRVSGWFKCVCTFFSFPRFPIFLFPVFVGSNHFPFKYIETLAKKIIHINFLKRKLWTTKRPGKESSSLNDNHKDRKMTMLNANWRAKSIMISGAPRWELGQPILIHEMVHVV